MGEIVSLQGPVEEIDGKLILLILLEAGGHELLRIEKGTLVSVDNENGKFNIRPVNPRPLQ